jgi:hypothetical protein
MPNAAAIDNRTLDSSFIVALR